MRLANLITSCTVLLAACAFAETQEFHLLSEPAHELFEHSAFAHGYIHGYEEGFHCGNADFQTGQRSRAVHGFKSVHPAKGLYRAEFGRKRNFERGYRAGFAAAYADAMAGRDFRGLATARLAARDFSASLSTSQKEAVGFDNGFADGYERGVLGGARTSRQETEFNATTTLCTSGSAEIRANPPHYCQGFRLAYAIGYADGFLREESTQKESLIQARK